MPKNEFSMHKNASAMQTIYILSPLSQLNLLKLINKVNNRTVTLDDAIAT